MARRAVSEFVSHYHAERNHQGIGNRLIRPLAVEMPEDGIIARRARLGGMLNYYERLAA